MNPERAMRVILEAVSGSGGLPWALRLARRVNIIAAMTVLARTKRQEALDDAGIFEATIEPAGVLAPQNITATRSLK